MPVCRLGWLEYHWRDDILVAKPSDYNLLGEMKWNEMIQKNDKLKKQNKTKNKKYNIRKLHKFMCAYICLFIYIYVYI